MVCDYWDCANRAECSERFSYLKYTPCALCVHFDKCDLCAHYLECADLVVKYLPNMFRRLVRDIRTGEDTTRTEQFINRNTLNGRKRK